MDSHFLFLFRNIDGCNKNVCYYYNTRLFLIEKNKNKDGLTLSFFS